MKNIFKILLSFMLILSVSCGKEDGTPSVQEPPAPEPGTNSSLVVMSYNIRHCAPYYGNSETTTADVNNVGQVLKKYKPDVVLLQEVDKNTTRSLKVDQAKSLASIAGYPYYQFFKFMDYQGGEFGVAMLSKYPLLDCITNELPTTIDGTAINGSFAAAVGNIQVDGKRITLSTVHLSVNLPESEKQLSYILKNILSEYKTPIILGGDFNSRPTNGTISVLDNGGFIRTNKDPNKFTIPSNAPNRELDYISFKPAKSFNIISHNVLTGISASDHLPIISTLELVK